MRTCLRHFFANQTSKNKHLSDLRLEKRKYFRFTFKLDEGMTSFSVSVFSSLKESSSLSDLLSLNSSDTTGNGIGTTRFD